MAVKDWNLIGNTYGGVNASSIVNENQLSVDNPYTSAMDEMANASSVFNVNKNLRQLISASAEYEAQKAEWDRQFSIQSQYSEDMYNKYQSPAAQARQMRAAGLNPDLQGVQSGGSPATPSPSGGSPSVGDVSGSGVEALTSVASTVLSWVQGAFGIASSLKDIAGKEIVNSAGRTKNLKELMATTKELMKDFNAPSSESAFDADFDKYLSSSGLNDFLVSVGLNSRERKAYKEYMRNHWKSLSYRIDETERKTGLLTSRRELATEVVNPAHGYVGPGTDPTISGGNVVFTHMASTLQPIAMFNYHENLLIAEARKFAAEIERDFQKSSSELGIGKTNATAKDVALKYSTQYQRLKKKLNENSESLVDSLVARSQTGDPVADALLMTFNPDMSMDWQIALVSIFYDKLSTLLDFSFPTGVEPMEYDSSSSVDSSVQNVYDILTMPQRGLKPTSEQMEYVMSCFANEDFLSKFFERFGDSGASLIENLK